MPHTPRHRPDWWPENEAWPPRREWSRPSGGRFFRRLGCVFVSFNLLMVLLAALALAFAARALGLVQFSVNLAGWAVPGLLALVLLVLVMLIVPAIFGLGLRRMTAPLDDLLKAAEQVAQGDTAVQVEARGPREMRTLVSAFNQMTTRLKANTEQRRTLLADLSHELRTPLTVIQGNLEGMLDGIYPADEANLRALVDETHILTRLVDDLRTLALSESGALPLRREPVDLRLLLLDVQASFAARAAAAGVALVVDAPDDLPSLSLDPVRMHQVLSNLVVNALRFSLSGGQVRLIGRAEAGGLRIEVQDDGPGFAPDDLPHAFERFHKVTDSGGMGLGLAICKSIVEAHGGRIQAANRPEGGSAMTLWLVYDV